MSETQFALSPPPHPPAVFRVLKHAWREYLRTGGGHSLTVNTPAGQAHTAPTTVTGTLQVDASVPKPVLVIVKLMQGGAMKATQTVAENKTTGAFTATFPANILVAGTATAAANSAVLPGTVVTTPAFTVT